MANKLNKTNSGEQSQTRSNVIEANGEETRTYQFTSESYTEGHPDKICDQISDVLLDEYLKKDPKSRCAIDCSVAKNELIISGKVFSKASVNHELIARNVIEDIGYINPDLGFSKHCEIKDFIQFENSDLNINNEEEDEFYVTGYACRQTPELMPMPIVLAHKLTKRLSEVRKKNIVLGLYPEGKSIVTVNYENNKPVSIHKIVILTYHDNSYTGENISKLREQIKKTVIDYVISNELVNKSTIIEINPDGACKGVGGPEEKPGHTGRQITSDTYGGKVDPNIKTLSGRDPLINEVAGAYFARFLAKTVVKMGAQECEVKLKISKSQDRITSRYFDTFDSIKDGQYMFAQKFDKNYVMKFLFYNTNRNLSIMIESLGFRTPNFRELSTYGRFVNEDSKSKKLF